MKSTLSAIAFVVTGTFAAVTPALAQRDPQPPSFVVYCRHYGSWTSPGYNLFSFTAAECGGILPDSRYVGALSKVNIAGGVIDMAVRNAGEPGGPGVYAWAQSGTAGHDIAAVFILKDPFSISGGRL